MTQNDTFNNTSRELGEKGQLTLPLHLHHQRIFDRISQQQKMERMKQEIINEVLSRISIMLETDEALEKIKSLKNAIDKLEE